jgi:hypothetical protein
LLDFKLEFKNDDCTKSKKSRETLKLVRREQKFEDFLTLTSLQTSFRGAWRKPLRPWRVPVLEYYFVERDLRSAQEFTPRTQSFEWSMVQLQSEHFCGK